MRSHLVLVLAIAAATGCATTPSRDSAVPQPVQGILPTGFGPSVDRDIARARAATAVFRELGRAVAAGYPAQVAQCIENPPHGGMGYHHQKASLLDARLDVEHPEILVYAKRPDGVYRLYGVEYILPFAAWSRTAPPTLFGQALKPARSLGIWYLHVWIWEPNASGLFADWNPSVKC